MPVSRDPGSEGQFHVGFDAVQCLGKLADQFEQLVLFNNIVRSIDNFLVDVHHSVCEGFNYGTNFSAIRLESLLEILLRLVVSVFQFYAVVFQRAQTLL